MASIFDTKPNSTPNGLESPDYTPKAAGSLFDMGAPAPTPAPTTAAPDGFQWTPAQQDVLARIAALQDELHGKGIRFDTKDYQPNGDRVRFNFTFDPQHQQDVVDALQRHKLNNFGTGEPAAAPAAVPAEPVPAPELAATGGHNRIYEGGTLQDVMDTVSAPARAVSSAFGAGLDAQHGGFGYQFMERFKNPDTTFGNLLIERNPILDRTPPIGPAAQVLAGPLIGRMVQDVPVGRAAAQLGGFGLDVATDPLNLVGLPVVDKAASALLEHPNEWARAAGAALKLVHDPLGTAGKAVLNEAGRGTMGPGVQRFATSQADRYLQRKALERIGDREAITGGLIGNASDALAREIRDASHAEAQRITGKKATGLLGTTLGADPQAVETAARFDQGLGRVVDSTADANAVARDAAEAQAKADQKTLTSMARGSNRTARTLGAQATVYGNTSADATRKAADLRSQLADTERRLSEALDLQRQASAAMRSSDVEESRAARLLHQRASREATALRAQRDTLTRQADKADRYATLLTRRGSNYLDKSARLRQDALDAAGMIRDVKAGTPEAMRTAGQAAADAARQKGLDDLEREGFDRATAERLLQAHHAMDDTLGVMGVQSGLFTKGQVEANQGTHARRLYDFHLNPDEFVHRLQNDPHGLMLYLSGQENAFRGGGSGLSGAAKSRTLPTDADGLLGILQKHAPDVAAGLTDAQRKDATVLAPLVRQNMGQITDLSKRVAFGNTLTGRAIARRETMNNVAAHFAVDEKTAEALNIAAGKSGISSRLYKQMPEGAKWGDLAGQWVPDEVHKSLMRDFNQGAPAQGTVGQLVSGYKRLISAWKFGKVILSPAARARNIGSNAWRAYTEAGMRPNDFASYLVRAYDEMAKDGPAWREALDNGSVFHGSFVRKEVAPSLARPQGAVGKGQELLGALKDRAAAGYERDENASKLAIYMWSRDKGGSPAEAAKMAERSLFDYGKSHPGIKAVVRSGAMPFATYPSLAVPAEARALAQHPVRLANIGKAMKAVEGLSPDNATVGADERRTMSPYQRDNLLVRLPWKDAAGRSQYSDMTYYLPFGQVAGDNPADQALQMANPGLNIAYALHMNRDPLTGRDIATDPRGLAALGQKAMYVGNALTPPLTPGVGGYAQAVQAALAGQKDREGKPVNAALPVLRGLLGLTVKPDTVRSNRASWAHEVQALQQATAAQIRMNAKAVQQGRMTRAEYEQQRQGLLANERAKVHEIQRRLNALQGLGQ